MKLKQDRVREFPSIWDSGPIDIDDQIAFFVGKNEAGNIRNRMDRRKILGARRAGRDDRYWARVQNPKRTAT